MLVIGIDPGTATTGYGLVRETDNRYNALDYGVIKTPAGMELSERLVVLHSALKEILLTHQPDSGAVEKLFFQKNVRTAIAVAQGRGVVLLALAQSGLGVSEYTPPEIKQSVTGYGGADKRQVQIMVQTLLELREIPKPDDAADALAVAICHLQHARYKALYESAGG